MQVTNDRLATYNNIPHKDGNGWTLVPTILGDIKGICVIDKCCIEDPNMSFSSIAWDMIVYFQSARDDGWKHNKFMQHVVANISDYDREICLQELTEKASIKNSSLIEEFGQLYIANAHSMNTYKFSSYGWTLIHHFDGTCQKKTNKEPEPPKVTILGEITPMVASIASIFLNAKPYIPPCHRGEPCSGCKEVARLMSVYSCDDINLALNELKENLRNLGIFVDEHDTVKTSSPEREDAIKVFEQSIPSNLTARDINSLGLSGQALCLFLYIKKSCTLKPFKLKYGIIPKGCRGVNCITCKNIQNRVAQYSVQDILNCTEELTNHDIF